METFMADDKQETQRAEKVITRRDFLVSNAAAVAIGVVSGSTFASTVVAEPQAALSPAPVRARRVMLDIDGVKEDVSIDLRESLWETMNYQLGLANSNLGCDRAQCGACAVVVDGRAVNSCSLLSARLGRGQKILTVAGISNGPGLQGLHPLQRAFWFEGGFQCGICTRGFIMAAYPLLQANKNPTTQEIKEALAGNICRCGEYAKILNSVKKAAADLRGEKVTYTAPWITDQSNRPATAVAANGTSKQFQFVTALGTIEQIDDLSLELNHKPGILDWSGTERTITPVWDPARLDEAGVRRVLAEAGHPVRP